LGRFLAAGAAASLAMGMWSTVARATSFTTSSAQANVNQTQLQVTQIEQTIQQEQRQSAALSSEFDAATAQVQADNAALAATDARLAQTRLTITHDKKVLAKAAVNDYVLGAQGTQITSIFSTAANTEIASQEYSQTAIGNMDSAKRALQGAQTVLASTLVQQQAQAQQAQAAVAKVQLLEQENQQAAQQSQATLTSLKGTLGNEVAAAAAAKAKREAAAAAAAAAAQRAAAAQQAAAQQAAAQQAAAQQAAAQQAAAQQAAQQAAAAAQVASELGTSTATKTANQAATSAGAPTVGFSGTASAQGQAAVRAAESQLGVPYVWGGESPGSGFDCSGLTQWSWAQAGVSIPRTSQAQYASVQHVPLSNLQPGDLLFYFNLDGTGTVDHVAMYVGSGPYGSQTVIQAPETGETVSYVALYTYGLVAAGQP